MLKKARYYFPIIVWSFAQLGCVTAPELKIDSVLEFIPLWDEGEKIPIKSFVIKSTDRPFETSTRLESGEIKWVPFSELTRNLIAQDLRDYLDSRFLVDSNSAEELVIDLEQAYFHYTTPKVKTWQLWVPVAGSAAMASDFSKGIPVFFEVEVNSSIIGGSLDENPVNVFIRRIDTANGFSLNENKLQEIYRKQISEVRQELFERLDAKLISQWDKKRFVGTNIQNAISSSVSLEDEIARLDAALAEGRISQQEYDDLAKAAKRISNL